MQKNVADIYMGNDARRKGGDGGMVSGINNNLASSFFTNLYGSSNSSNSTLNFLGDYASIKNGSYKKLLKAYYKIGSSNNQSSSSDKTSDSKDATKKMQATKLATSELTKSAKALMDDSLFAKSKAVKNEQTGEVTYDYDRTKIEAAVKDFVSNYNAVIEDAGNADSNSILTKGVILTGATKANTNMLAKAGITIGKDNKLVLDEEKLKTADVTDIKTLFHDKYSYGSTVERNSSAMYYSASSSINSYARKYGSRGVNYDYSA